MEPRANLGNVTIMLVCITAIFTARSGCFRVLYHPVALRSEIKCVCVCVCVGACVCVTE